MGMTQTWNGNGREIRCRECRLLLAIETRKGFEVRYKDLYVIVRGTMTTECRRCGTVEEKINQAAQLAATA
jgi:hypothetical protein